MSSSTIEFMSLVRKKPYVLFFLISGVMLVGAVMNLHSYLETRDYIPMTGEVSGVEQYQIYRKGHAFPRYRYDVTWIDEEGKLHTQSFDGQLDKPEEGEQSILVRPDQKGVYVAKRSSITENEPVFFTVGIVSLLIGIVCYIYAYKRRDNSREAVMDRAENTMIYSVILLICCMVGMGYVIYDMMRDRRKLGYINSVSYDLIVLLIITIVICILLYIRAKKKYDNL
ncbi:MAG: hypothetical protein Q4D32_07405 [Eubacteriales bacterium]|nr:hypothetical protein [Eubacteriales bacterium]